MGRTPQRFPGQLIEEDSILFEDRVVDPEAVGTLWRKGDSFYAEDGTGKFNLRTGGSGITESQHKALKDLIHFIDDGPADGWVSGAYKETLPAGDPFPAQEIWWTGSGKTHKIVSLDITRNSNKTPATEQWKIYDADGSTVLVTLTDAISYSAIFETSRTRTWS